MWSLSSGPAQGIRDEAEEALDTAQCVGAPPLDDLRRGGRVEVLFGRAGVLDEEHLGLTKRAQEMLSPLLSELLFCSLCERRVHVGDGDLAEVDRNERSAERIIHQLWIGEQRDDLVREAVDRHQVVAEAIIGSQSAAQGLAGHEDLGTSDVVHERHIAHVRSVGRRPLQIVCSCVPKDAIEQRVPAAAIPSQGGDVMVV